MSTLRPSSVRSSRRVLTRTGLSGLALSILLLAGCGGDDDEPYNLGVFCSTIGNAFCDRVVSCGFAEASERSECTSAFREGCCGDDGTCSDVPKTSQVEKDSKAYATGCASALKSFSCSRLNNKELPAACEDPPRIVTPTPITDHVPGSVTGDPIRDMRQLGAKVGADLRASFEK